MPSLEGNVSVPVARMAITLQTFTQQIPPLSGGGAVRISSPVQAGLLTGGLVLPEAGSVLMERPGVAVVLSVH